jgi:4a-hydroxytetrahydrobiopterin dehydratase
MDTPTPPPLAQRRCIPCEGGIPKLDTAAAADLLGRIDGNWKIIDGHHLYREFRFPDFVSGLAFVNAVAAVAEENGHHPDLLLTWGKVGVTIWTHVVGGLSESDFILAAKVDALER